MPGRLSGAMISCPGIDHDVTSHEKQAEKRLSLDIRMIVAHNTEATKVDDGNVQTRGLWPVSASSSLLFASRQRGPLLGTSLRGQFPAPVEQAACRGRG